MIKKIYKKYEIIFNVIFFSIFPIMAFYLMEFYEHNPFEEVRFMAGFFNIILFELIAWILYFVTGRAKWALRAVFIVAMVFGLINHYVMLFRSTPFVPWDIFSIGTATSVASNYDFAPTAGVVVVTVIFIALIMLMHFVDFRIKWKFRFRLIPTVLGLLVMCLFVNALQDEDFQTDNYLYPFLFTPAYMTKVNGMAVTFAMDLKFVAVDKPDGYSRQKAKELLDSYAGTDDNSDAANNTAITDKSDYPNIIVVMDEAFSDLSVLGDFDTNTDYMPFVHSLEKGNENTITGYLNTSVCGGNTADTEFEFLTGNTMAFLPNGSIPYQQYIKSRNIPYIQSTSLDEVMPELDILYMTRVQRERFFNEEDYLRLKDSYILTPEKLKNAKPDLRILHPLPRVNEISVAVDEDPRACYFKQAQNGRYIRMALIMTLLGLKDPKAEKEGN